MGNFHCKICGFSVEKSSLPVACPYCGKKGEMVEEESAEQMISEA